MRPSLDVPFSIRAGNRAISPNETPGFASPAHAGFAASSALSLLPIDGAPRTLRRLQTSWTLGRAVLNFVPASAEARAAGPLACSSPKAAQAFAVAGAGLASGARGCAHVGRPASGAT